MRVQTPEIKRKLNEILTRYERYTARLHFPGDWGERAFRGWLVMDLLERIFGWEPEHIVLGERFDILLVDDDLRPVVNIETKKPRHKPSVSEVNKFANRLSAYGTLRYAFLTDGYVWERLELEAPRGRQTVVGKQRLDIRRATLRSIASFFDCLWAGHYCEGAAR